MKPDSPTANHVNEEDMNSSSVLNILSSVANVGGEGDRDFDNMDDEVMNFMHSHIHKRLLKLTTKASCPESKTMMDQDTKAYFDEVIRGSALFGLLPDRGGEFDEDDRESESSFFGSDDGSNDNDNERRETDGLTAKFQLSRLLLAKKVAEAFKNKSDKSPDDPTDDSSHHDNKTGMTWSTTIKKVKDNSLQPEDANDNSDTVSHKSTYSIETDLQADREKLLEEDNAPGLALRLETDLAGSLVAMWQDRLNQPTTPEGDLDITYPSEVSSAGPPSPLGPHHNLNLGVDGNGNRSTNPATPSRLPLNMGPETQSGAALEECRSRLRKTQFDYASDSGPKSAEATSPQFDYRDVLKKKDKA